MVQPLWWQKYRPNTLDKFIFQNDTHRDTFNRYLRDKSIPHLLLYGAKGTGKTTLAGIIISELVGENITDILRINGSSDGTIDNMRTMVLNHINKVPMGSVNIVFIDEADGLSSSSQNALRGLMEEYDDHARFIFTCNYVNKLTPELRSRFTEFKFNPLKKDDVLDSVVEMLLAEGVDLSTEEDLEALESYATAFSSDFRKLINALESSVVDGKLTYDTEVDNLLEYNLELIDLLGANNWIQARELIAGNVSGDELLEVYRFLYTYLSEIPKFKNEMKWKKGILTISDYMYRHAVHPDSEINFAGCIIKLSEI